MASSITSLEPHASRLRVGLAGDASSELSAIFSEQTLVDLVDVTPYEGYSLRNTCFPNRPWQSTTLSISFEFVEDASCDALLWLTRETNEERVFEKLDELKKRASCFVVKICVFGMETVSERFALSREVDVFPSVNAETHARFVFQTLVSDTLKCTEMEAASAKLFRNALLDSSTSNLRSALQKTFLSDELSMFLTTECSDLLNATSSLGFKIKRRLAMRVTVRLGYLCLKNDALLDALNAFEFVAPSFGVAQTTPKHLWWAFMRDRGAALCASRLKDVEEFVKRCRVAESSLRKALSIEPRSVGLRNELVVFEQWRLLVSFVNFDSALSDLLVGLSRLSSRDDCLELKIFDELKLVRHAATKRALLAFESKDSSHALRLLSQIDASILPASLKLRVLKAKFRFAKKLELSERYVHLADVFDLSPREYSGVLLTNSNERKRVEMEREAYSMRCVFSEKVVRVPNFELEKDSSSSESVFLSDPFSSKKRNSEDVVLVPRNSSVRLSLRLTHSLKFAFEADEVEFVFEDGFVVNTVNADLAITNLYDAECVLEPRFEPSTIKLEHLRVSGFGVSFVVETPSVSIVFSTALGPVCRVDDRDFVINDSGCEVLANGKPINDKTSFFDVCEHVPVVLRSLHNVKTLLRRPARLRREELKVHRCRVVERKVSGVCEMISDALGLKIVAPKTYECVVSNPSLTLTKFGVAPDSYGVRRELDRLEYESLLTTQEDALPKIDQESLIAGNVEVARASKDRVDVRFVTLTSNVELILVACRGNSVSVVQTPLFDGDSKFVDEGSHSATFFCATSGVKGVLVSAKGMHWQIIE